MAAEAVNGGITKVEVVETGNKSLKRPSCEGEVVNGSTENGRGLSTAAKKASGDSHFNPNDLEIQEPILKKSSAPSKEVAPLDVQGEEEVYEAQDEEEDASDDDEEGEDAERAVDGEPYDEGDYDDEDGENDDDYEGGEDENEPPSKRKK